MYFNCYLSHFIVSDVSGFLMRRQNRPDILSAGEEVLLLWYTKREFSKINFVTWFHHHYQSNPGQLGTRRTQLASRLSLTWEIYWPDSWFVWKFRNCCCFFSRNSWKILTRFLSFFFQRKSGKLQHCKLNKSAIDFIAF